MDDTTSKASLFLMELILSILFFSLSAAVCVQLFVKSHLMSRQSLRLNYAVIYAESMADTFYSTDADLEKLTELLPGAYHNTHNNTVNIYYDEDFNRVTINDYPRGCRYILTGELKKDNDVYVLDITFNDYVAKNVIYEIEPAFYIDEKP